GFGAVPRDRASDVPASGRCTAPAPAPEPALPGVLRRREPWLSSRGAPTTSGWPSPDTAIDKPNWSPLPAFEALMTGCCDQPPLRVKTYAAPESAALKSCGAPTASVLPSPDRETAQAK